MNEKVYVVGAGLNRSVSNWDGVPPPLINDFFQIVARLEKYSETYYTDKSKVIYEYIEKYWKKTKSELGSTPFDLEDCFTLIDSQQNEAQNNDEKDTAERLLETQRVLVTLFAEVLSDFEHTYNSGVMSLFEKLLYKFQPTIISFNYDLLLENAIQSASGLNESIPRSFLKVNNGEEIAGDTLDYSHFNWNSRLAYGIEFDEIKLPQAGVPKLVDRKTYYGRPKNKLYDWSLLKLHGSLNWFEYTSVRKYPMYEKDMKLLPEKKKGQAVLVEGNWWLQEPPDIKGWYLKPIIVTPTLHKDQLFNQPLFKRLLRPIWSQASKALQKCKELVVVGYSFPNTDFATKKLFLEAFANHKLEKLTIANPDTSVVQKVKELCHFNEGVTVYRDLSEYIVPYYRPLNSRP